MGKVAAIDQLILDFQNDRNDQKGQPTSESYDRQLKMLMALIDIGMGVSYLGCLIKLFPINLEQYRYFNGPIVMHKSGWGSYPTPAWVHNAIVKERLEIIFEELKAGEGDGMASKAEVMQAIIPASQDAPLNHDDYKVFAYAARATIERHYESPEMAENIWGNEGTCYSSVRYDFEQIARTIRGFVVKNAKLKGVKL